MKERIFKYMLLCAMAAVASLVLWISIFPNFIGAFLGILCAIMLCTYLAQVFSKRISGVISDIDLDDVDPDECDEELKPVLRKIVRQESLISRRLYQLKRRQEEFFAITENMAEGLIVSDKNGEIILSNTQSREMLLDGKDANSVFDFCKEEDFLKTVRSALSGTVAQSELHMPGKIYKVYANPLITDKEVTGTVVMLLDITEESLRENMRREFTSNVSHELKTPLTSIYGISEILAQGIVRQEDIPKFAKSIFDESGRLITLVNDIIKLSQMDENSIMEEKEPVEVLETVKNVCARLEKVAQKKQVHIEVNGENAYIFGIKGIIEEMIYNLADNGIKYNKEDGTVTITVEKKENRVIVSVKDTGIGISNEHILRIFERFYRVDKSHSKQVGGTGLGLSIVKHGASFHGASIDVQSVPDKGTEIKLSFLEHAC